ncbi:thiamine ABC transporter substrate-binding protein [Cetobacterium sp. 2A]|uniref:thiamine ABC transporter substrate-binding protein n=1 Tax=Cetobacterium sp. 2A TaxID=2754723 RepID=UPI00163CE0AD|nr:thiamine ABC transporter substrate-binding protein [Cetobacterium sp. 2A]MBC2855736.1 thiamine ABC transporter substrate-binding protein [Cetobacterium sp. 2A]
MKKIFYVLMLIISSYSFSDEVIIYGPNSMKWIEKNYGEIFHKNTGHTLKFISVDGLVARLKLEKKNPKADVVIGLTQVMGEIAKKDNLLSKYSVTNIDKIENKEYILDSEGYLTPFDYGLMAINYDTTKIKKVPKNLKEIGEIKKSLFVESPMETTGQELLFWSIALYGENWKEFWKTIKPSIYAVEPGWSETFAKFSAGEAPMMTGYATSSIFFNMNKDNKFQSFIPEDGGYVYLENASLVQKEKIKDGSIAFMESILSEEFQKLITTKNYMFPVIKTDLPDSYDSIPKVEKTVILSEEQVKDVTANIDKYKKELLEILKK